MGIVHIMERGGDSLREYKKALKMAKKGIELLCDLSDEMEDEYGERDESEEKEDREWRRRRGRYGY